MSLTSKSRSTGSRFRRSVACASVSPASGIGATPRMRSWPFVSRRKGLPRCARSSSSSRRLVSSGVRVRPAVGSSRLISISSSTVSLPRMRGSRGRSSISSSVVPVASRSVAPSIVRGRTVSGELKSLSRRTPLGVPPPSSSRMACCWSAGRLRNASISAADGVWAAASRVDPAAATSMKRAARSAVLTREPRPRTNSIIDRPVGLKLSLSGSRSARSRSPARHLRPRRARSHPRPHTPLRRRLYPTGGSIRGSGTGPAPWQGRRRGSVPARRRPG